MENLNITQYWLNKDLVIALENSDSESLQDSPELMEAFNSTTGWISIESYEVDFRQCEKTGLYAECLFVTEENN